MNELLNIINQENGDIAISGRELYEFLDINTQYTKWFERMAEYGFEENVDYLTISQKRLTGQGNVTQYTDHVLKLDTAKQISMIQRTEKGKQAREYFIEIEKKYKAQQVALPQTYKEALLALVGKVEENERLEAEKVMLIEQKQEVEEKLDFVVESNITFDQFNRYFNALIKLIADKKHTDSQTIYNECYYFLKSGHGIDLNQRQRNKKIKINEAYFAKSGKYYAESTLNSKTSKISCVKAEEFEKVLAIVKSWAIKLNVEQKDIDSINRLM